MSGKADKQSALSVMQSYSLRNLIEKVNSHNIAALENGECQINKDNTVGLVKENDAFFLLYFK